MVRARRAALAVLILAWSVATLALTAAPASGSPPASGRDTPAVAWPVSPGLLIAEVVTGGTSASDEYVEITNASSSPIDLNGLELAYASTAGTNATRRAGWATETLLPAGRHLLIANAGGTYASGADATYAAGMAATGGALVLRPAGGAPIDAVGWGTAINAFVETGPAPAPAAGASIERGPGGYQGNVKDTNDNATDWSVNPAPRPENLGAPARPAPGSNPSPGTSPVASPSQKPSTSPSQAPTPGPSPSPIASPSPNPSPKPSPIASPSPKPSPITSPSPNASPNASPSPVPSATPRSTPSPTPLPSPVPSPTLVPSPSPSPLSIAEAIRAGGTVTVDGVVTTSLTLIDSSERLFVIQDATAAIEVRLPVAGAASVLQPASEPLGPGSHLLVAGTVGRSYGAPRINATTVTWLGTVAQAQPLRIMAAPGPGLEWRLVRVTGRFDAVHKLGLRWRAELIVGSIRIPVIGLIGARIGVGRLIANRTVTIVGIVRRAYPSAIDQRFAIDLRSLSDLAFASAGPVPPAPGHHGGPGSAAVGAGTASDGTPGAGPASSAQPLVGMGDLASRRGQHVRVGGLVTRIDGAVVSLDDGVATGRLILTGAAAAYLDLVRIGDPLEATGVVASDGAGAYLLVSDPDGVSRAADPGAPRAPVPDATPPAGLHPASAADGPADGAAVGTSNGLLQALAGALLGATLALLLGVAMTRFVARRRSRRARPTGSDPAPPARPTLGPG